MWSLLNTYITTFFMKPNYSDIIKDLDASIIVLLDKLKRYLSVGKASVMVGCGFSLNAESDGTGQMREWNALNVDLFKSLYGRNPSSSELDRLNPVRLAAQVENTLGNKELDEIIMNALPDKSVYPGVLHKKLMKLRWRDVFTTNYDTLLERSCDESGSAYTLVTTKETLLYSKSPRIIKLHGSFPNIRPFIMSEEAFRTYPQKYPEFVNTVRQSLIENLFCLIGFSGNDPNFLSWLGWIRDVMGEQMTNAILVDYRPNGYHISEKQLFASRKIDILNLAEISGLNDYKEALDFFLTYLGTKEHAAQWSYPDVDFRHPQKPEKSEKEFEKDIRKMEEARKSYPGWVFYNREISYTNRFPFKGTFYDNLPDKLKLDYLYELDWLLDICLYPKAVDWYLNALEDVKGNYSTYNGMMKEKATQLLISLLSIYREKRDIDPYLTILDFINRNCLETLTTKQRSIFYYEQCQWNLALLDYKSVFAILLKWKLMENDYLGALWQSSVYAELGDRLMAEDMLTAYYSRLTTKLLLDGDSAYLNSCKQLYSYVIPRTIRRNQEDMDFSSDKSIDDFKRSLLDKALKEQPVKTQSHGFNLNQVTNTTHLSQGGFVNRVLYPEKYIRLCYLHGNTFCQNNYYATEEYGIVLSCLADYHFYEAVARLIRSGHKELVEKVVHRGSVSHLKEEEAFLVYTDLIELLKEVFNEGCDKRKLSTAYDILIPLLQRLVTKVDDGSVMDLFDFIITHSRDRNIKRNEILKTLYNCATEEQKAIMFVRIMSEPIVGNEMEEDLLWPEIDTNVDVTDAMCDNALKNIKDKHLRKHSYLRILALLQCTDDKEIKEKLEAAIVQWRQNEKKDVNAFFSYHVASATNDADRAIEDRWVKDTLDVFINHDYTFTNSSETISNFSHFADNIVPAMHKLNNEQINNVVNKISQTLESYLPHLGEEDDADIFGGLRFFINQLLDVLDRLFRQIDFKRVDSTINKKLGSVLVDYIENRYPCLLLLSVTNQIDDKKLLASFVSDRLHDSDVTIRYDARRSMYYLFKNNPDVFDAQTRLRYLQQYAYFLKYSHSKALREDLYFMAQIIANDYVDKNNLNLFNDALYTIRKEYETYEMSEEYKADIAHNACILAGVLSQKLEHITSGAHAWKEFYEDSEQFRDVRNGYEEGIRMCKQQ